MNREEAIAFLAHRMTYAEMDFLSRRLDWDRSRHPKRSQLPKKVGYMSRYTRKIMRNFKMKLEML